MLPRPLFAAPWIASLTAFTIGAAWLQTRAALPDSPLLDLAIAVSLWAISFAFVQRASLTSPAEPQRPWLRAAMLFTMLITAMACGHYYAAVRAELRMADALPAEWEGRDILVRGVIDDLPADNARGTRFSFAVEEVLTPDAHVPSRLALTWYTRSFDDHPQPRPELHAGARWQLNVRLKRSHASINPGGFDTEAWLLQHRIRATGYVRTDGSDNDTNALITPFAARPLDYIQRLRETLRARITHTLADKPYTGVVVALVIGEQRAIPDTQWQVFNRTGITHLVSISGLHVTIFSSLIGGILFWLFRRAPRLTSRCPAIKLAVLAGFLASAFYVALAGAGIPAQRTLIMLAVAAFALWTQRVSQPLHTWLWALFIVVLWDPWAPLAVGFWLSFGAVGWLLYAASGRLADTSAFTDERWHHRWRRHLMLGIRTQCVVTLGLVPLLLAVFQQFSLVSLPANFWAIPWVTLMVIPVALLGAIPGLSDVWWLAHFLIEILMNGLTWLAALPMAVWQQHGAPAWSIAASILGIAWLLAPRGVPGRALGALWCLPMFLILPAAPEAGAFEATVLDVGQGMAVVVRTQHHTLLYDTGPSYHETADAGSRIVAPFLQFNAVTALDALVVSHSDDDHAGGTRSLLATLPVHQRYISTPTAPLFAGDDPEHALFVFERCTAGEQWTWDGVHFRFLSPPLDGVRLTHENDRSCVLKIDAADTGQHRRSLLLTGDIGRRLETWLIEENREALSSSILVAPHHGSKHSSSPPFIDAVAPDFVVYSVGYRNRFDFPRSEVVARYQQADAVQWRTDQSGAIRFQVDGNGIIAEGYRQTHPRYWRTPTP